MTHLSLKALIIEDKEADVSALVQELQQGGFDVSYQWVDRLDKLQDALSTEAWDVIISGYTMSDFDALDALKLVKAHDEDLPLIIVTNMLNEEIAVAAMKAGAADFFGKQRLRLLVPAVEREKRDAEHRRQRKRAEQFLRQSEMRFETAFHASPIGIVLTRLDDGRVIDVNQQFLEMLGYTRDEMIGKNGTEIQLWTSDTQRLQLVERLRKNEELNSVEIEYNNSAGQKGTALLSTANIEIQGEPCVLSMVYDITSRKQAQQEVNFQAKLLNTVGQAVVATDLDGYITYWNHAAEQIYGWLFDEVRGRPVTEIRPIILPDSATKTMLDEMRRGQPWTEELQARHRDGTQFPLLVTFTPIMDEGVFCGVISVANDISQLKESIERLSLLYEMAKGLASTAVDDAQNLYRLLYEQVGLNLFNAPHFVIAQFHEDTQTIQAEYAIVDNEIVDPSTFPPREVGVGPVSRSIQERRTLIVNPLEDFHKAMAAQLKPVLIGDERIPESALYVPLVSGDKVYGVMSLQHYEPNVFNHKDVSLVETIATQAATVLENAQLYQTVSSHAETLELRVQERTAELESARDWVASILASTTDAILLVDQYANLVEANPAFEEQFQYTANALAGHSMTKIITRNSIATLLDAISKAIEGSKTIEFDAVCIRNDNTLFEAEFSVTPLLHQVEAEPKVVCVIHDVSRHKQIEASLRSALDKEKELNELKMRFSSMVSHEFRTPLSVILSSADILMRYSDRLSEERKLTKLNDIENQVNRLVNMLDNILSLSRAESVDLEVTRKSVELNEICIEVVEEIQKTTDQHQVTLNITGQPRTVTIDPNLISDVIRNLLSNSIKYSPEGGAVTLTCDFEQEQVVLTVKDNGLGIPEDDLIRLFDAFHRGKNVRDISGTGLGLAIVKQAVDAHGGAVDVQSTLGAGTTFRITLPV